MRKLLILLPLILIPSTVSASNTSIKINNNTQSTSNSDVSSTTNIKIETNGQTMEYKDTDSKIIEIHSKDEETNIKINGEILEITKEQTPTPTINNPAKSNQSENNSGIINNIKKLIEKFFSIF